MEEQEMKEQEMMRVYLAAPYSSYDDKEFIVNLVTALTADLYMKGILVYSPLTMTYLMCQPLSLPGDYNFWKALNESYIKHWATHFWVAAYKGWEESAGCYTESVEAFKANLKLNLLNPFTLDLTPLRIHEFRV